MCAFVLLYRALGAPRSFEALAVLGGILSTYWINVLWGMGAQLYWEKQQGQLQLYFAAPCSRMAILTGMALGGVLMTTVRTVFAIGMGFGAAAAGLVARLADRVQLGRPADVHRVLGAAPGRYRADPRRHVLGRLRAHAASRGVRRLLRRERVPRVRRARADWNGLDHRRGARGVRDAA